MRHLAHALRDFLARNNIHPSNVTKLQVVCQTNGAAYLCLRQAELEAQQGLVYNEPRRGNGLEVDGVVIEFVGETIQVAR